MFNSIDIKFDGGIVVTYHRIGMSEFYDMIKLLNRDFGAEKLAKLAEDLETLKKIEDKDRTPEQKKEWTRVNAELSDVNIESEKKFRKLMMGKALIIKKGNEESDHEEASLFTDLLMPEELVRVFDEIRPDIEKKSPSQ